MDKEKLESLIKMLDSVLCNSIPEEPVLPACVALAVNLSTEEVTRYEIPRKFLDNLIGGPALGARLWAEFADSNADSDSFVESDDPIVISAPALWGNTQTITFLSPQTKQLTFNYTDDSFGPKLRACGYSAVIITGRCHKLSELEISPEGAVVGNASNLKGLSYSDVAVATGNTCMAIGVAGENSVPFASCICDGAETGRGGLGFALGKKNLKVISVVSQAKRTEGTAVDNYCSKSKAANLIKTRGTNYLITLAMKSGWAPIDNFSLRTDPRLFHLCGTESVRRLGPDYLNSGLGYAETLMLGSDTGCYDIEKVFERYGKCIELGLDCVSMGNILGFMRAVDSDFIDFEDNESVINLIEQTAYRTGKGEDLSNGVRSLGQKYNSDRAYHINGLECGPFDFRGSNAQAVNSSVGTQFPVFPAFVPVLCNREVHNWVLENEDNSFGLLSLGIDPFVLFCLADDMSKTGKIISELFHFVSDKFFNLNNIFRGTDIYPEFIKMLGAKGKRLFYEINGLLSGCSEPSVPDHFTVDPSSNSDNDSIVPFNKLIAEYKRERRLSFAKQDMVLFETEKS